MKKINDLMIYRFLKYAEQKIQNIFLSKKLQKKLDKGFEKSKLKSLQKWS